MSLFRNTMTSLYIFISIYGLSVKAENEPAKLFDVMGFEIEIGPRQLSAILPYFDTQSAQQMIEHNLNISNEDIAKLSLAEQKDLEISNLELTKTLVKFADMYLENETAFHNLDPKIQQELSEGLNLHKSPQVEINERPIARAQEEQKQNQLILPDLNLQKPKIKQTDSQKYETSASGLALPPQSKEGLEAFREANQNLYKLSDWPLLHQRWSKISIEKRIKMMNFKYLPLKIQAELILALNLQYYVKNPTHFSQLLPLKNDAPDWLKKLEFEIDGLANNYSVEIKPPTALPLNQGMSFMYHVMKSLGINPNKSSQSMQNRTDYALHIHLGIADTEYEKKNKVFDDFRHVQKPFGKSRDLFEMFKTYIALKMLSYNISANENVINTLKDEQRKKNNVVNTFSQDLDQKGLLRLITSFHIELREIPDDPKTIVDFLYRLLQLPEAEAMNTLQAEVEKLYRYNKDLKEFVINKNPFLVLNFEKKITPELEAVLTKTIEHKYLMVSQDAGPLIRETTNFDTLTKFNFYKVLLKTVSEKEHLKKIVNISLDVSLMLGSLSLLHPDLYLEIYQHFMQPGFLNLAMKSNLKGHPESEKMMLNYIEKYYLTEHPDKIIDLIQETSLLEPFRAYQFYTMTLPLFIKSPISRNILRNNESLIYMIHKMKEKQSWNYTEILKILLKNNFIELYLRIVLYTNQDFAVTKMIDKIYGTSEKNNEASQNEYFAQVRDNILKMIQTKNNESTITQYLKEIDIDLKNRQIGSSHLGRRCESLFFH